MERGLPRFLFSTASNKKALKGGDTFLLRGKVTVMVSIDSKNYWIEEGENDLFM